MRTLSTREQIERLVDESSTPADLAARVREMFGEDDEMQYIARLYAADRKGSEWLESRAGQRHAVSDLPFDESAPHVRELRARLREAEVNRPVMAAISPPYDEPARGTTGHAEDRLRQRYGWRYWPMRFLVAASDRFEALNTWVDRHGQKVFIGLITVLLAAAFLPRWIEERLKEGERRDREAAEESVGISASVAGGLWASASKACARIGIQEVRQCAGYKGLLLQEQTAVTTANLAVDNLNKYYSECGKVFSAEQCTALVQRAATLSLSE